MAYTRAVFLLVALSCCTLSWSQLTCNTLTAPFGGPNTDRVVTPTTVVYTCKDGYEWNNGQVVINCINGVWQSTDSLVCRLRGTGVIFTGSACNVLTAPLGGANTERSVSASSVTYRCRNGYSYRSGLAVIPCINGQWQTNNALTCQLGIVNTGSACNPLLAPVGGPNTQRVVASNSVTYTCNRGYEWRSGQLIIPCTNGQWQTNNALTCQLSPGTSVVTGPIGNSNCNALTAPLGGPNTNRVVSATSVTYRCNIGYQWNSGQLIIPCFNGQWQTNNALTCRLSPGTSIGVGTINTVCGNTPGGRNSIATVSGAGNNLRVDYACVPGTSYSSGVLSNICINGQWNQFQQPLNCA